MGAKQSAETKYAIKLVREGHSIAAASRKAGIWWSTLRRALNKLPENSRKSTKDSA